MDRLPAELLQLVLSQLPLPQLLGVQRVSRRWRGAVQDLLRCRQELDLRYVLSALDWWTNEKLDYLLRLMPALRVLHNCGINSAVSYKTLDIIGERRGKESR